MDHVLELSKFTSNLGTMTTNLTPSQITIPNDDTYFCIIFKDANHHGDRAFMGRYNNLNITVTLDTLYSKFIIVTDTTRHDNVLYYNGNYFLKDYGDSNMPGDDPVDSINQFNFNTVGLTIDWSK